MAGSGRGRGGLSRSSVAIARWQGEADDWIGEFTKEREALNRPSASEVPPRVSRSEFVQAYRSAVERKLKVFTSRENVALSREALCSVLAEGNLILRPDVANARLEGTLTISREELFQEKQIDIKMVAGAGCCLCLAFAGLYA